MNIMALAGKMRPRRRPADEEHRIQVGCVQWFRMQHPELYYRLCAIPNGGARTAVTGAKLKAEGVVAGVADLVLLVPTTRYGALFIEMKTPSRTSRQSQSQLEWQADITRGNNYKYVVCRSLDDFRREVSLYLNSAKL